jgi:hypothetical protein
MYSQINYNESRAPGPGKDAIGHSGKLAATIAQPVCSTGKLKPILKMKTNILPIITFVAAIAAVFVLPKSPSIACFLVTVPGIVSLFVLDYGRSIRPLGPRADITPFGGADRPLAATVEAA